MKRSIDTFERQIVAFVLAWAPYGGPRDDDTFPEFGMCAEQLTARFHGIVAAMLPCWAGLDPEDRDLLSRAWRYGG